MAYDYLKSSKHNFVHQARKIIIILFELKTSARLQKDQVVMKRIFLFFQKLVQYGLFYFF